jgi:hypothetical protein
MKCHALKPCVKALCLLCVLCGSVCSFALNREAFSFTSYDLHLQIDPEQHRLGVRGKITLRNDASSPQQIAVLQISSSLGWRAIKAGDKPVQFVTQPFTSDIDHTGGLSEAIVTLPQAVAPHATVDLAIAYEGVIELDATRLTRISTPEDLAKHSDWDQITSDLTAVRGAGYVAWYPIATDVANLSEEDSLSEVLARWKAREADSHMHVLFESTKKSTILFSGTANGFVVTPEQGIVSVGAFGMILSGTDVPTFVIGDYKSLDAKGIGKIDFLSGKDAIAQSYADVLANLNPLPGFRGTRGLDVADFPDSNAAKFVTQSLLLLPLHVMTDEDRLTLVYALARQRAASPRPWITEGLAHFAQVRDVEQQHGHKAAVDYLAAHESFLVDSETRTSTDSASRNNSSATDAYSLIKTTDDMYLQSKAMWVWWMLHDMIGGVGMNLVLAQYSAMEDKDPSYMPKLLNKLAHKDLQWFFDDWVYYDHGLPDFKVQTAFSSKTSNNSFLLAVTIVNLGSAGAEVPVIVKFAGGEVTKRLEVRAKDKATIRIETPAAAQEVVVNDGSVPERDVSNNSFKVPAGDAPASN